MKVFLLGSCKLLDVYKRQVIYMQYGPDPNAVYPNEAIKSVCFIKNIYVFDNGLIKRCV